MKSRAIAAALLALLALPLPSNAAERSSSVRSAFQREHPCPSTGKRRGACPGYVADHIVPLCAGGPDAVSNMQWQTVEAGKAKDREERAMCRANVVRRS